MAIINATEVNAVRGARGGSSTALNFGDEKIQSSAQEFALGQRGNTPDGRVFRYAKNSSAALTTSGNLLDGIALIAAHDMDVPCTGSTAAGSLTLSLEVPTTDLTLNQYAGGYVIVNDGPAIGEVYRIASHPVHDASDDNTVVITLDEPTVTATTTSTLVGLVYSPYIDVKVIDGDGTRTTKVLGVNPMPVTASYYFWIQTSGISSVLAGAVVGIVGDGLKLSQASGESGAADLFDTSTNQDAESIGTATGIPSVATDTQIVDLAIKD